VIGLGETRAQAQGRPRVYIARPFSLLDGARGIGYDHRAVEVPYVRAVGSERARQSVPSTHAIGPLECDTEESGVGNDDDSILTPCEWDGVTDERRVDVAGAVVHIRAISLPCALNSCQFGAGKSLRQDR